MNNTDSYLAYIPTLSNNPSINSVLLMVLPAILYTGASYGHLLVHNSSILTSIFMSIVFATLEYIVRVPVIKYSSDVAKLSNGSMQVIWMGLTLITSYISGYITNAR